MQPTGRTAPSSARALTSDGGQRNVKLYGHGLESPQLMRISLGGHNQHRGSVIFLLLVALLLAPALRAQESGLRHQESELAARADSLGDLSPEQELNAALARGDRRYIGLMGYTIIVPGVSWDHGCHPRSYDSVVVIAGTSDAVDSKDRERLNRTAAEYAKQYNTLLLQRTCAGGSE